MSRPGSVWCVRGASAAALAAMLGSAPAVVPAMAADAPPEAAFRRGGGERRPRRGGLPAHAPDDAGLARATPTSGRCCCPTSCPAPRAGRRACTSTGRTTRAPTTTRTSSPPPASPTGALFDGRLRDMLRNEIRYTNTLDGIPADLDLETRHARPAQPLRRRRVREGRPHRDHRAPRPHALVLPDGGHDGGPHGARPRGERLRAAARPGCGVERRRPPDPRPARRHDRRPALPRVGGAHRRRLRAGGPPAEPRPARLHVGLPEARGARPHAPARPRQRDRGRPHAARGAGERARRRRGPSPTAPRSARMLDRVLASANPDGLLYDEIRPSDLPPVSEHLSDNWGYVYGAVYTHFMVTGEERYREAVRRVLTNLPRYRGHDWENGSQDGYADAIESALYLVAREPVPEALDWIESETKSLIAFQQEDGTIERWYGDGNWSRTLLLYAMWKTQGCVPRRLAGRREARRRAGRRAAPRVAGGALRLEGPPALRPRASPPRPELRPQLRPPQRVAGVVHGGREHALPADGRGGPGDRPPGLGPRGRDRRSRAPAGGSSSPSRRRATEPRHSEQLRLRPPCHSEELGLAGRRGIRRPAGRLGQGPVTPRSSIRIGSRGEAPSPVSRREARGARSPAGAEIADSSDPSNRSPSE